jgi:hypothetical protein
VKFYQVGGGEAIKKRLKRCSSAPAASLSGVSMARGKNEEAKTSKKLMARSKQLLKMKDKILLSEARFGHCLFWLTI